jgi:hypothetical protein
MLALPPFVLSGMATWNKVGETNGVRGGKIAVYREGAQLKYVYHG